MGTAKGKRAESKPEIDYININTISQQIDACIDQFLDDNGIERDYKSLVSIKHSTVNYMFSYIYKSLFKPNKPLWNNQKSLVDYDNIDLLQVLADKFIEICQRFNKSLGLMSFSYMIGVNYSTLYNWLQNDEKLNPKRLEVLKSIQEGHKAQHIAILNESPVGALAVANNDIETGLQWATNHAIASGQQAVFLIPSERLNRLGVGASAPVALPVAAEAEEVKNK